MTEEKRMKEFIMYENIIAEQNLEIKRLKDLCKIHIAGYAREVEKRLSIPDPEQSYEVGYKVGHVEGYVLAEKNYLESNIDEAIELKEGKNDNRNN